jgi:ATP-binding cassette subfamily B protein
MVVLLWVGLTNIKTGKMSLGDLAAFMSYIGYLSGPIESIAFFYLGLQPILVAYRRIFQILSFSSEPEGNKNIEGPVKKIKLEKLSFSFKTNQIFDNWSYVFESGQKYFIPWLSGKGKTTLARLLCKFTLPESGKILFNETDIQDVKISDLRQRIGYMTQETHLFSGTIRENLILANPEATDDDLEKALIMAEAWEFVKSLSDGLSSKLNDRGTNLSAGQRQRLSIARIILKAPEILILDEPFANLDTPTATKIYANLEQFLSSRITLILSHQKEFCSRSQQEKTIEVLAPS